VYASDYPDYQADLDDIRRSLGIHEPTPYGVPRENAFFLADVEPDTFDPALWQSSADGIIGDLFSGLVQLDASLRPIPDLAASWDISADGTVYTFHLRQDVTFHNGEPFTAQDVVFSWERACDPALESDTALTYLGDILGVAERIAGEADRIAGLRVVDDFTLEVTLDGVKAYFLAKLAYPTSWIVDESSVQDIEETPIGTGPFVLVQHVEDQVIIVARNPAYHRGFVPLEYIVYLLYPGPLIRLYEAGEIDVAYIDDDLLVRAEDPSDPLYGDPQPTGELCTWYAQFDASRPPFNDSLVRQAFAQAVDREQYVEVMGEGQGVEARGLYPPGLPGYSEDLRPLPFDPQAAQDLLRQSSFAGPQGLPEIVLSTSGAGLDLSPSASLLVDMWRQNLGVTVRVEQIDSDSFYDQLYAGNHGHIILTGWCADYPDPENFADVLFHTGSPQNFGDYSNPDLDALLERARVETDLEERLSLYRQAEQILAEDAAAVFLQHSSVYYTLVKTYVHGYVSTPIGIAQHMNLSIVHGE
jgi:ABC-type transport system substrate-binding protein